LVGFLHISNGRQDNKGNSSKLLRSGIRKYTISADEIGYDRNSFKESDELNTNTLRRTLVPVGYGINELEGRAAD
jgi:hypothetical protein